MSEEEKKAILVFNNIEVARLTDEENEALVIIFNLITKQEKVIEKLARAIMFMGTNPDIIEEEVIRAFTENLITEELLDKFRKEYISKDKIRKKLLEPIQEEGKTVYENFMSKSKLENFEIDGAILQELGHIEGTILELLEE